MPVIKRSQCPLCTSTRTRALWQCPAQSEEFRMIAAQRLAPESQAFAKILNHFQDAQFSYDQCPDCGFLFQGTILDTPGMIDLYTREPQPETSTARPSSRNQGYRFAMRALQVIHMSGKKPADCRVLDFGSSDGLFLDMVCALGAQGCGVEIDDGARAKAIAKGHRAYATIEEISEVFDAANADQTLEHVPDPVAELQALARRVRSGGIISIGVPSGRRSKSVILAGPHKHAHMPLSPFGHINTFTNKTLRLLGKKAGLIPVIPKARYAHRSGLIGQLVNIIATPWEFRTKTSLLFRKP